MSSLGECVSVVGIVDYAVYFVFIALFIKNKIVQNSKIRNNSNMNEKI